MSPNLVEDLVEVVRERFLRFAQGYLHGADDGFAYTLKIDHTLKVLDVATAICQGEGLTGDMALATRLAALLHDVGRFPQYREYRTFRDRDSVNHAKLSVRHLLREKLLEGVPGHIWRLVLGAVYLHNTRLLPATLPPELLQAAQIVRDSDKLDIMRVMIEHFSLPQTAHPEVSLDAKHHPTNYTREVLTNVMAREVSDYRRIVWVNDFKLLIVGWLYDLNTITACRLLIETGRMEGILDLLPQDKNILALREQIAADLAKRLKGDYVV